MYIPATARRSMAAKMVFSLDCWVEAFIHVSLDGASVSDNVDSTAVNTEYGRRDLMLFHVMSL